jgi:predicted regulator of Ras-like GTPase activity (Roadblock/LC7/MglB family)
MTREEKIKEILLKLKNSVESITGASIVTKRGLIIAKIFDFEINSKMLGGIAASIVGPTTRISKTLFDVESFKIDTIETEKGSVILMDLESSILVVMTKPEPNVGLILFEMEEISKDIEEVMK